MNALAMAIAPDDDSCRRRSLNLLAELQREVQHRAEVGGAAADDVDTSIAWAAMQAIDWLAWEATDREAWPALVRRFRLNIDPYTDQRAKLRALQEHALNSCAAMRVMEKIASAGRLRAPHRSGGHADGAARAQAEQAGRAALAWLTQFTRECGAL